MKKHANIPIFIPHLGCPNQCVFCNQKTISGTNSFDITKVDEQIKSALSTISFEQEAEIAFFGGSFTGIDRTLMISLLDIAKHYIDSGSISSIRLSTRPDYIDNEILDILKKYGVKTIELGLQSISDDVLLASKRGHTSLDAENACRMIVDAGFSLVGQMMIGLPGSTLKKELETADFIIRSGAVSARIYPTVVFYDTELCNMAIDGIYTPISLDEAIERSCKVFGRFVESDVNVIRIGLCSQDNLYRDDTYFSGPNHPALGELVEGEYIYLKTREMLINSEDTTNAYNYLHIQVAQGMLSRAIGQNRKNKIRLADEFSLTDIIYSENVSLDKYEIKIDLERK